MKKQYRIALWSVLLMLLAVGGWTAHRWLTHRSGNVFSITIQETEIGTWSLDDSAAIGITSELEPVVLPAETLARLQEGDDRQTAAFAAEETDPQGTAASIAAEQGLTHILLIEDKTVRMIYASCPDKICVHQGAQQAQGASIICLPYRLIVTVERQQDANGGPDAVTQ